MPAPNDVASIATWQVNCSARAGGNKRLHRMVDWDVADGASKEAVGECGSRGMVAFVVKPGAKTISFNFRETKGVKRDVDWEYLAGSDEVIELTKQVTGGRRKLYPQCAVSSYTETGNEGGELTYTVEIIALSAQDL